MSLSPLDIAKEIRLMLAITEQQIATAITMRADPWNWELRPVDGTTRTIYRRVRNQRTMYYGP